MLSIVTSVSSIRVLCKGVAGELMIVNEGSNTTRSPFSFRLPAMGSRHLVELAFRDVVACLVAVSASWKAICDSAAVT